MSRPKVTLLESGLTARLVNISPSGAAVGANEHAEGQILEGSVTSELLRQLTWSPTSARPFHYRDRDGVEIELVLETDDGRVAAIEVKAAATVGGRDARWLNQLHDKLGPRFVGGVILHTGATSSPFGSRITATPIDTLGSP